MQLLVDVINYAIVTLSPVESSLALLPGIRMSTSAGNTTSETRRRRARYTWSGKRVHTPGCIFSSVRGDMECVHTKRVSGIRALISSGCFLSNFPSLPLTNRGVCFNAD